MVTKKQPKFWEFHKILMEGDKDESSFIRRGKSNYEWVSEKCS